MPAERRKQASAVGARASWNSFFSFTVGCVACAWHYFSFFLDSPSIFFFVRRSSFYFCCTNQLIVIVLIFFFHGNIARA